MEDAWAPSICRVLSTIGFMAAALGMWSATPVQGTGVTAASMDTRVAEGAQCRIQYKGNQPAFSTPPSYVVDAPLPSIFCEQTREWVFIYETAKGIQFYTLDPGKRESYRDLFHSAARGDMSPWVMRTDVFGRPAYFINANPAVDAKFDYALSPGNFRICAELAARPHIKTVAASRLNECGAQKKEK
jgi:hypothetical protein